MFFKHLRENIIKRPKSSFITATSEIQVFNDRDAKFLRQAKNEWQAIIFTKAHGHLFSKVLNFSCLGFAMFIKGFNERHRSYLKKKLLKNPLVWTLVLSSSNYRGRSSV